MPLPASASVAAGLIPIDTSFTISSSGAGSSDPRIKLALSRTAIRLARQTGLPILPAAVTEKAGATLLIVVESRDHRGPQRLRDDESYSLEAANGRIRIAATGPLGALHGIETFLQLVQQNTSTANVSASKSCFSVPNITIHDQPRFPWRGLSLDVSRHFIPVEGVKRTIDGLSAVKLNVLHWHLSDDQGFRVESKKYPRLQQYGSDGLFYTQAEIRDVVAYARDRGVRVVPEFDMPGHTTSFLPGYPDLGSSPGPFEIVRGHGILPAVMDPSKESTYRFLNGFIAEMAKLFPDEYFHIGGDEVNPQQWNENKSIQAFARNHHLKDSKGLQTYFNGRLLKIVAKQGKHMEGWDEIYQPDLPKSIVIQSWRGQRSLWQAARDGFGGILSAGYYLDLMYPASQHYAIDPLKLPPARPGSPEASQPAPAELTAEQKKLILGGEAAMWEELATAENLDAKLWPRLAAIAERFWSPESVTDVPSMYARLVITNRWLEYLGLTQRSSPELMRRRLAGEMPSRPLDDLATAIEPVKGYQRHAENYSSLTPFNRLIDAIAPESDEARNFRDGVDRYLAASSSARSSLALHEQLSVWADAAAAARPLMQSQSILNENLPVDEGVAALCRAGLEALTYLDGGTAAPGDWKKLNSASTDRYAGKRVGDFLIQFAPGVQKLVAAVQSR